jgi:phosphatidylethanolamine/phosphatidyl-N-methylethanolamine N-methyltransferase
MDRSPGQMPLVIAACSFAVVAGSWLLSHELVEANRKSLLHAVAVTIFAPIYWNGVSRLEYRTLMLTKVFGGSRTAALYVFAASILALSGYREQCFFRVAVNGGRAKLLEAVPGIEVMATCLVVFGTVLSMSGFVQLGVKGTYMGEAFGFFCPCLITSLPFNAFQDPMYLGSSLMHLGWALQAKSLSGLYVAAVVWLTYWIAARVFEGPFTTQLYRFQSKLRVESEK